MIVFLWKDYHQPPIQGSVIRFQPLSLPIPNLTLPTRNATPYSFNNQSDTVILLNFWATWCGPCIKELPSLLRLQNILADEPFHLVTIALDRQGQEVVEPFLQEKKLSDLTVLFDPLTHSLAAFGLQGIPTSILISKQRIRGRLEGAAVWSTPEALELIRYYLLQG